jgi:uncharacterized RDD family membrane protein YckC
MRCIFRKEVIMSKRTMAYLIIVLGVVVLVISLAADAIGIRGSPGIGWKQLTGAAVGLILMICGVWMASRKAK